MNEFNMTEELLELLKKQQKSFDMYVEKTDTELGEIKTQLTRCVADRINLTAQMTQVTKRYGALERKVQKLTKKTA